MFKKDNVSHVRMSKEEKDLLEKASKLSGKSLSDYIRTTAVSHALSLNLNARLFDNNDSHTKKLNNIINIILKNYTLLNKLLEKDFEKEGVIKLLKETEEWIKTSGYLE